MPRCSGEGRIIRTPEVELKVWNPDGGGGQIDITLPDPWVFKVLGGEWHPDDGQGNLTDINNNIPVPAVTLVGERTPNGLGILYVPDSTTPHQRYIFEKIFGPTLIAPYLNTVNVPEGDDWLVYHCYFGLNQPGAVVGAGTQNEIKGGWAISVPDGTSHNGMVAGQVNLLPDSFAIVGGSYGSLFGGS